MKLKEYIYEKIKEESSALSNIDFDKYNLLPHIVEVKQIHHSAKIEAYKEILDYLFEVK